MLSLIFLQQTYQSGLPELPYVTFMDSIYNICYLTNMFLFGLYLWGSITYHSVSAKERSSAIARIAKVDLYFQMGLLGFIPLSIAAEWLARKLL